MTMTQYLNWINLITKAATFTYILSIGLLCWGWRWRSVSSWGDTSCSGSEKSSSPAHWPSGGKDSSRSRCPTWYPNCDRPGCDSSSSPVSKRVKLAGSVIFSNVLFFTHIDISDKSLFHTPVKCNEDNTDK